MLTIKNQAAKIVVFFAAVVMLFTGCGPAGPRALFAGKKLMEQGKYAQAIPKLRSAATLLQTNALAYSYLGLACHLAGERAEAEQAYQHALSLNPDLAEDRYNLGCLWLDENKLDSAKNTLTAYTLRRPQAPEGWLKLGTAQLRSGMATPAHARTAELAAAERSFNEALRLNPRSAEALTGIGLARAERNRPLEAEQFFARALQTEPTYGPALLNLAIVAQEQLNNRQLALQKYRQYLALKPQPANTVEVQSIVRQLEQELTPLPARPVVSTSSPTVVATAKPAVAEPVRTVAKPAMSSAHNSAPAPAPLLVVAAKAPPETPTSTKSLPTPSAPTGLEVAHVPDEPALRAAKDEALTPAPAAPTADRTQPSGSAVPVPVREPKHSLLHRLNPLNLLGTDTRPSTGTTPLPKESQSPSAEGALNDSTSGAWPRYSYQSPAKPAAGEHAVAQRDFAAGVQAQRDQHFSEAMQAYRRALQADPSFFDAWYNLGLAATESGHLQAALGAYEYALALRRDSLDARYNFALVLKQANYPLDAAQELEKILAIYPNDSRANLALGNLYTQQLHQPAKARAYYVKVLQSDPRNPQAGAIRYWLSDTAQ